MEGHGVPTVSVSTDTGHRGKHPKKCINKLIRKYISVCVSATYPLSDLITKRSWFSVVSPCVFENNKTSSFKIAAPTLECQPRTCEKDYLRGIYVFFSVFFPVLSKPVLRILCRIRLLARTKPRRDDVRHYFYF